MLAAGFSKVSKETLGVYRGVAGTGEDKDGERSEEVLEIGELIMDEGIVGGEEEGESRDVRVVGVSILDMMRLYRAVSFVPRFWRSLNHAICDETALPLTSKTRSMFHLSLLHQQKDQN